MKIAIIVVSVIIVAGLAWYVMSDLQVDPVGNANTVGTVNTRANTNTVVNTSTPVNTAPSNTQLTTNQTNTSAIEEVHVAITATGFSPQTVTIVAGQSIVWTNSDSAVHTPSPDDHPDHDKYAGIWDDAEQELRNGERYEQLFLTPGTYTYHDHEDERLTGTIIVQR